MNFQESNALFSAIQHTYADQISAMHKRGVEPSRIYIGENLKKRMVEAGRNFGLKADTRINERDTFMGLPVYTVSDDVNHFQVA